MRILGYDCTQIHAITYTNYASIFDGGLLAWVNCGSVATNLCSSQLASEDDSDNLFACMMCHEWAKSLRYPYYPFAGYSAVNYG